MSDHTIIDGETGEVSEPKGLDTYGPGVADVLARAEIDTQIATAKRYPRNPKRSKDKAMGIATMDEDTAAGCFYALKRQGKAIEGPSIRLAEIVAGTWGNIRVQSRIVNIGAKEITAEAVCHDLESNTAVLKQCTRRITDKHGRPYGDDMIAVTCQAAASIAMRNAVFSVVPLAVVNPIFRACQDVVRGDAKTLSARRTAAMDWFTKAGATQAQVLEFLGRQSVEEITPDDLVTLTGVKSRIRDDKVPIDEALAEEPEDKPKGAGVQPSNLGEVLGGETGGES